MKNSKTKLKSLLAPGHRGCSGCGQLLAARHVADTIGPNCIIAAATGCLEVTTTPYPESAWEVPWIHSLFENPAAIASGIYAALKTQGKDKEIKVVAMGGDGATFDIGYGLISGMWEREEDILYVCYDNEAYMNTGIQSSGATPYSASTTTSPAGRVSCGIVQRKKDMLQLAIAHRVPYVAAATAGFPLDIQRKVKKALEFSGPKYIQILVPCVPGWGYEPNLTLEIGRLAQKTGLWPIFEAENGKITTVMKVPENPPKVEEYLKLQKRFKHLFKPECKKEIEKIQSIADENIRRYHLK